MRTLLLLGSLLAAGVAPAQQPARSPSLEPLTAAVDRMVASLRLDGAALAVLRKNGEIHRSEHGGLGADHVIPIASASKWLAVATVLSLVDDGVLDLDLPLSRYIAEFDRDDKDHVTLRQCLSCTAGFAARLGGRMRGWGTDEFAAAVADAALRHGPGDGFRYGGVTFQVAAVAAERATGRSWHELFAERIAEPLGMGVTRFGGLHPIASEPGTARLPWVAGGAVSSLDDYSKFVRCLLDEGRAGGRQVLSEASVAVMFGDQVPRHVEVHAVGVDADDIDAEEVRYGLGTWIFDLGGGRSRVADPGAFGFTPWIDRDLGIGGVFAVEDRVRRVFGRLASVMATVREVAESPLVAGTESTITLGHDGRLRRYHLHVPPQAGDPAGLPLVLVLHGGGGNGEQIARTTGFGRVADREGFIAAFPDGTGRLRNRLLTWNSGTLPVFAVDNDVDDVGFLREVVADIGRRVPVDASRVFAVGHSNGGMMCHRLAREAADLFTGIAVVAGAMNYTETDSDLPIGVLIVHGTADESVRYGGGRPKKPAGRASRRVDASVQDAIDYYLDRNSLLGYPDSRRSPLDDGAKIDTYGKNRIGEASWTPLRVITLEGGGHAWPGAKGRPRLLGDRPYDFEATQAIWDFFTLVRREPQAAKTQGRVPAVPR